MPAACAFQLSRPAFLTVWRGSSAAASRNVKCVSPAASRATAACLLTGPSQDTYNCRVRAVLQCCVKRACTAAVDTSLHTAELCVLRACESFRGLRADDKRTGQSINARV
jgi:hypothetical protein